MAENNYRRIVQVETTEVITRMAHIEVFSAEPIDTDRLLEGGDMHDDLVDHADELSCEKDNGRDVEITIIEPADENRYRLSLDGEFDIDEE